MLEVAETCGKIPGAQIRLAGPTFPGVVVRIFRFISIYNHNICILLIKTNLMIYICYIFCWGEVEICLLAVGDDERDIGDNVGDDDRGLPRAWTCVGRLWTEWEVTRNTW
jgi:hypothetical protein